MLKTTAIQRFFREKFAKLSKNKLDLTIEFFGFAQVFKQCKR